MHLRRCQAFRRRSAEEPWETVVPREIGAAERRSIFRVCEAAAAAGAGRAEAAQALRGKRSEKLRRLGLTEVRGHGALEALDEDEVLARIDTLVHEGWLEAERDAEGAVRLATTARGRESAGLPDA